MAKSKMKSFQINRVQRGYWGQTILRTITIKADSEDEAYCKMDNKKDNGKLLRNGDRIAYEMKGELVE